MCDQLSQTKRQNYKFIVCSLMGGFLEGPIYSYCSFIKTQETNFRGQGIKLIPICAMVCSFLGFRYNWVVAVTSYSLLFSESDIFFLNSCSYINQLYLSLLMMRRPRGGQKKKSLITAHRRKSKTVLFPATVIRKLFCVKDKSSNKTYYKVFVWLSSFASATSIILIIFDIYNRYPTSWDNRFQLSLQL